MDTQIWDHPLVGFIKVVGFMKMIGSFSGEHATKESSDDPLYDTVPSDGSETISLRYIINNQ